MNRLKFMGAAVDEAVHAEAHTSVGAERIAAEAGFNCVYLTYDWGFPPEVEVEDWAAFRRAVDVYHTAGVRVFGYIQTSNCVYDGSYRDRDWYALDPRGRPFYYYTGRYMTCWSHPEWLDHLRDMVRGVLDAGADGVFFDNPWLGAQPFHLSGAWLGPVGCYCPRCRAAFRAAAGLELPRQVTPPPQPAHRAYLRWRAGQVAGTLAMLAAHARHLKPEVIVSANDFDAVMRPVTLAYGIDLSALARVQDLIMIEDYGLPRWGPAAEGRPLLVNNALTLRTARALVGPTPLSTNPYDKGIGFDGVYPARRLGQGIAEAAACGAAMVVKGTEYVEDGAFTLLTAEQYAPQRQAIGRIHRWLEAHAALYDGRREAAALALLHPGEALWLDWDRLAPPYFGAGQALLAAGLPWRVVVPGADLAGVEVLLHFGDLQGLTLPPGARAVAVPELPGWAPRPPSFLARRRAARGLVAWAVGELYRAYFRRRWARRLGDRLGLVHFFLQSPYFRLPPPEATAALLAALGPLPHPRVTAAVPVLAELWRQAGDFQLHLVNYAPQAQPVTVDFGRQAQGSLLSPDGAATPAEFRGTQLNFPLDLYAVLCYR